MNRSKQYDDYRASYQDKKKVSEYEKSIYEEGGFDDLLWQVEKEALTKILNSLPIELKNTRALDFACGTGRITSFLENFVGSLEAIDISREMIEVAKTKVKNVHFYNVDITQSEETFQKFDLITTFRFVLFAEADLKVNVFKHLNAMLKDENSRLIVGLHGNPYSRRGLIHIFELLKRTPKEQQLKSFSISDLEKLLSKTGFEIEKYEGMGFVPRALFKLFKLPLALKIEQFLYKFGFLKFFGSNQIVVCKKKVGDV